MPDRRIFLREMLWLLCAMTIPLIMLPPAYSMFEFPKVMVLRAVVLVLAVATVAGGNPPGSTKAHQHRMLVWATALYAGSLILTTVFSTIPSLSLWGNYERQQGLWTQLSYILLFLCTTWGIQARDQHKLLWNTLVLGSIPVVFLGLLQVVKPLPTHVLTDSASFITSTLGRSNFFASYLVLIIPLTAYSLYDRLRKQDAFALKTGWLTYVLCALLIGQVICLIATRSRAAWFGLVAASTFFILWVYKKGKGQKRLLYRIGFVGIFIFIGLIVLSQLPSAKFNAPGLTRLQQTLDPTQGSFAARLTIWRTVLDLILKRPILGHGLDTLRSTFTRHYPPQLVFYQGRSFAVDRAHNMWLDAIYHTGFLGFCAAALVWLTVVKTLATSLSKTRLSTVWLQGALLGAALIGHCVEQQFSFEITATSTVTWLIAALIMTLENRSVPDSQPEIKNGFHYQEFALYGMTALIIVLSVVQPIRADIAFDGSQDWSLPDSVRLDSARRAVQLWPLQTEYWLGLAQLSAQSGDMAAASEAIDIALQMEPDNPHIYALWGDLYAGMDPPSTSSIDQAVDAYETTVLLAPTVAGYHTALGATLARQGDYILSRLILERAVALDPTDPSAYAFLAATYTALGETDLALNAENQAYDGSKKP